MFRGRGPVNQVVLPGITGCPEGVPGVFQVVPEVLQSVPGLFQVLRTPVRGYVY